MIDVIDKDIEIDDYKIILYNHLFTHELDLPVLHFEKDENSFVIYILPDDLELKHLRLIDDAFDEFELVFMPIQNKLIRLKFILKGD